MPRAFHAASFSVRPARVGPVRAADFETWLQEDERPLELIAGWVVPMSPGNYRSGRVWGKLHALLLPHIEALGWSMYPDSRHRLPAPEETVLFPDIAIHAVAEPHLVPGTDTIARVPDLIVEVLSDATADRDMAPDGAKFLAYRLSGVGEYYYARPDGSDAAGWLLQGGAYVAAPRTTDGYFHSPLLGREIRVAPPGVREG
ncbi:MAG: Uma2 family endonuclease [Planctomycetes bacterium]|nr:Uma2 family endonuclease [Planctomycetota bacterium]